MLVSLLFPTQIFLSSLHSWGIKQIQIKHHVLTPNESPLHVVHSHGRDEGSLKLIELTNFVTKLSESIEVLDDDLKKTKQTYSSTFTKLILRIKKLLPKQLRRREKAQIARDEEISRQLLALDEERVTTKTKTTKDIDWNDPSVQKIFEIEQIKKDTTRKRKKSLPRKRTRSSTKKQKVELDDEKEDLKGYLDIVPREDVVIDVDFLSTKYPIVDWKTYTLSENFMYYKSIRGDGSLKNYKILSEMLYDFDRQDVVELYRLVKESWSLCDFCGVHILLMKNGIAIHMLTEKKYPLSQEMISKMLSKRLEVDQESTQAYELLKFIRSQVKK
ncbi:hypothetical protein Tco_1524473 [Tanacetum coccineum]